MCDWLNISWLRSQKKTGMNECNGCFYRSRSPPRRVRSPDRRGGRIISRERDDRLDRRQRDEKEKEKERDREQEQKGATDEDTKTNNEQQKSPPEDPLPSTPAINSNPSVTDSPASPPPEWSLIVCISQTGYSWNWGSNNYWWDENGGEILYAMLSCCPFIFFSLNGSELNVFLKIKKYKNNLKSPQY